MATKNSARSWFYGRSGFGSSPMFDSVEVIRATPKPVTVDLMLVQGYITESLAEVETSLDETREDSASPDWQYFKGQHDALKDLRKYIERKAQEARQ